MLHEIATWSSTRKFESKPVTKEQLLNVMEAGRRAPSWKNIQPWKFIAIDQEQDKAKLSEAFAMGALIKRAPAVILCVGLLDSWEKTNQRKQLKELFISSGYAMSDEEIDKRYLDTDMAQALSVKSSSMTARTFENMGIAYGFMILEAVNQGLGACILGELDNELVEVDNKKYNEIKEYFGLGKSQIITAAIILGVPERQGKSTPRKPSEEVIAFFKKPRK